MHELSIAENLIDIVMGQLAAHGTADDRVSTVCVRVGVLSSVVPLALKSAFRGATHGTPLANARLEIESIPASVWCPNCLSEKLLADPRYLRCPSCGQRTPDLRQGLELELSSVELME